jgi:soluble lytic murein transglycosylase-like protein
MPYRYSSHLSEQTTASTGGGCFPRFLLPPLAVICAGTLWMYFVLSSSTEPVAASSPGKAVENRDGSINNRLSSIFTPEVQYWAGRIQDWAEADGLDPNLVATVMQIESCGDPVALSRAGAMGLFQVMPFHFDASDDPYDPNTNARRGLDYLSKSLELAHGDARLALAGYNGGTGVIGLSESDWAAETQRYAYWGSGIYAEASSGAKESIRLGEWLLTSGASLCRQAHDRLGINP